jgi:hypothetical protein
MKPLKETTINNYSATQLLKHLDRVMTKYWSDEPEPYRINFAYGEVYEYDACDRSYRFSFKILDQNKHLIIDAMNTTWSMIN